MPEDLVSEALRRTLAVRPPAAGLLVHSTTCRRGGTWGSQYTATRFRDLLANQGVAQSVSRRGNCYDNVQAESFWSRLNTALRYGGSFPGRAEARLEVAHYITEVVG